RWNWRYGSRSGAIRAARKRGVGEHISVLRAVQSLDLCLQTHSCRGRSKRLQHNSRNVMNRCAQSRSPQNSSPMKTLFSTPRFAPLVAALLLLHGFKVAAVTFTNDTVISFNNTNYDGLDIVVTNCTLTVDGIHAFTTVQVLNAGNLTHTYAPDGMLVNHSSFTNELRVLSTTNTATLSN